MVQYQCRKGKETPQTRKAKAMKKTIVVLKDNGEQYVLGFDYVHMAMHDPKAVYVYCPQTDRVYLNRIADAEK